MRKRIIPLCILLMVFLVSVFVACASENDDKQQPSDGNTTEDNNGGDTTPETGTGVDLVLFMGQSNMAGRGDSSLATVVEEGHAYEFRAISDSTKLYPVIEPFGINENNAESGVSENKKTGSLVSAFCESYYSETATPIVAVSCSQGGTGINFWDTNRPAYEDACNRLRKAETFLSESEEFYVRGTYIVWLQGETDADNGVTAARYTKTLNKIFGAFKQDVGVDHCFIIPIGGFNGTNQTTKGYYDVIRQAQIDYCAEEDYATVISIQLHDMYLNGQMTDNFHYTQNAYEIVGRDAGANMGKYLKDGNVVCVHYEKEQISHNTGGAWLEEDGKVVIPAVAAFENSVYAAATSRVSDNVLYYWQEYSGLYDGAQLLPDNGKTWNTGTGFENAPQLNFTFYIRTPGVYYLYLFTEHPDTGGNSVLVGIDEGALISCAKDSFGVGVWQSDASWAFNIAEVGEHTITVCAREDGCVIDQIVLSTDKSENFRSKVAETESERLPVTSQGAFAEVNGVVCLDLFSAFEKSDYCNYYGGNGSGEYSGVQYYWQRSSNGRGVQIMPKDTMQWSSSTASVAPKLTYQVEFETAGDYYVYVYASFTDATSDSAMISVDNGTAVELARSFSSSGSHRWSVSENWKITVPSAGIHTVTVYARESGAAMHKIYLSRTPTDCVGAIDPAYSPRLSIGDSTEYTENKGVLFAEVKNSSVTTTFKTTGTYTVYGCAQNGGNAELTVNGETLNAALTSGWSQCGEIHVDNAGVYTFEIRQDSAGIKYIYAVNSANLNAEGVETLVFGDSYTNKTYWTTFDEQMSVIGGLTIGVSGSTVSDWVGRVSEFNLYAPENIVVHLGVNDINRGKTGEECGQSVIALLTAVKESFPQANIFYVNICDNYSNTGNWEKYAVSNALVKEFAENTEGVYCLDFNTAMKSAAPMTNNGFVSDNLHPNAEGYVVLSELIVSAVKEVNGEV